MHTSKDYLHIFLDMGDALLNSGAEIFRVEDTLNRMGYACGAALWNFQEREHGRRPAGSGKVAEMISRSWSS